MDAEPPAAVEPDLVQVQRGSRTLHRMARLVFGLGILGYTFLAVFMLALFVVNREQALFAPTMTLSLDTALALLGLCATVLIALVASLWASGQVADASLSRGRRHALTAVTVATGAGSIIVGTAGALHRPNEGWNFITVTVLFGLGLVLAYITADVAVVMIEDRSLDAALRRHDAEDRRAKLRTARQNWLAVSRAAGWKQYSRPGLARFRQTAALLLLLVALFGAALTALGGRPAVTGYLGWLSLDLAVNVLIGQLATHHLAVKFVARRWEPFWWYCMYAVLCLLLSALGQLQLGASMEAELPADDPLKIALVVACWLVPLLLCLFGLTVAPRRWRRLRPMTQIRWSVISAIGHEIDRIEDEADPDADADRSKKLSLVGRLMRAIRRANGTEELRPGG